jgi:uncharacterized membrane protein
MLGLFRGTWRRVLACFLAGLLTILPLVITVAVIVWVAGIIQRLIGPGSLVGMGLESMGQRFAGGNELLAYCLGCVLVLASIFVLGIVVQMGFRRLLNAVVSPLMKSIPIAGSVYGAATQIVGLLDKRDKSDLKRMQVVYCLFGKEHGTGLLALLPTPDRYPIDGRDYYIVYIPTSPVPMTGGLLFVPADSVRPVDISVESLMSIYLSMGVTGPEFLDQSPLAAAEKSGP